MSYQLLITLKLSLSCLSSQIGTFVGEVTSCHHWYSVKGYSTAKKFYRLKYHILDSGVWYSSFWSDLPKITQKLEYCGLKICAMVTMRKCTYIKNVENKEAR